MAGEQTETGSLIGVLAGDIIKSSRLSADELQSVRDELVEGVATYSHAHPGSIIWGPAFFRGDGWQVALGAPVYLLRVAVFLRACLVMRGLADSRIAFGVGIADRLTPEDLGNSTGEAFTIVGHALDDMNRRSPSLQYAASPVLEPVGHWVRALSINMSGIMDDWTRRQAEMIHAKLLNPQATHEELAKIVDPPTVQQVVAKTLASAGEESLWAALQAWEMHWNVSVV